MPDVDLNLAVRCSFAGHDGANFAPNFSLAHTVRHDSRDILQVQPLDDALLPNTSLVPGIGESESDWRRNC